MKRVKTFSIYIGIGILLLTWWVLALGRSHPSEQHSSEILNVISSQKMDLALCEAIAPIQRDELERALYGDAALIDSLIHQWAGDAELMSALKLNGVGFFDSKILMRCQLLARVIAAEQPLSDQLIERLQPPVSYVLDDTKAHVLVSKEYHRFLPQTYAAATMLFALVPPSEIIAIPRGMREEPNVYPQSIMNQIPLNSERVNAEELFLKHPQLAYVASYSQPAMIEALKEQGIPLFYLSKFSTESEVASSIKRLGITANAPARGELLAHFVGMANKAISNQWELALACKEVNIKPFSYLCLQFYSQYQGLTEKNITVQHLKSMGGKNEIYGLQKVKSRRKDWTIPLTTEDIISLNPSYLILLGEDTAEKVLSDPALQGIEAIRQGHICVVDSAVQYSPTQLITLAKYDLMMGLSRVID